MSIADVDEVNPTLAFVEIRAHSRHQVLVCSEDIQGFRCRTRRAAPRGLPRAGSRRSPGQHRFAHATFASADPVAPSGCAFLCPTVHGNGHLLNASWGAPCLATTGVDAPDSNVFRVRPHAELRTTRAWRGARRSPGCVAPLRALRAAPRPVPRRRPRRTPNGSPGVRAHRAVACELPRTGVRVDRPDAPQIALGAPPASSSARGP